jgi:hypothetical protein
MAMVAILDLSFEPSLLLHTRRKTLAPSLLVMMIECSIRGPS